MTTVEDLFNVLEKLSKKYEDKAILKLSIMEGQIKFNVFPVSPLEGLSYYRHHISFNELFKTETGFDYILEYKIKFALKAFEALVNE